MASPRKFPQGETCVWKGRSVWSPGGVGAERMARPQLVVSLRAEEENGALNLDKREILSSAPCFPGWNASFILNPFPLSFPVPYKVPKAIRIFFFAYCSSDSFHSFILLIYFFK